MADIDRDAVLNVASTMAGTSTPPSNSSNWLVDILKSVGNIATNPNIQQTAGQISSAINPNSVAGRLGEVMSGNATNKLYSKALSKVMAGKSLNEDELTGLDTTQQMSLMSASSEVSKNKLSEMKTFADILHNDKLIGIMGDQNVNDLIRTLLTYKGGQEQIASSEKIAGIDAQSRKDIAYAQINAEAKNLKTTLDKQYGTLSPEIKAYIDTQKGIIDDPNVDISTRASAINSVYDQLGAPKPKWTTDIINATGVSAPDDFSEIFNGATSRMKGK